LTYSIPDASVKVSVQKGKLAVGETNPERTLLTEEKQEQKEYIISKGDVINISVKGISDYDIMAYVLPDGKIIHPKLGEFVLSGYTEAQAGKIIEAKLSRYLENPQVIVSIKGHVNFLEVRQDELFTYKIKSGDVISISINGRSNYDITAVVQSDGTIYYSPLGNILVAGKNIDFISNILMSKLPINIKKEQIKIQIREIKAIDGKIDMPESKSPILSRLYGYDFFSSSRNRIIESEKIKMLLSDTRTETKDAISGYIAPIDMKDADINATIPDRYILRPGDKITLTYWSESNATNQNIESIIVDDKGEVMINRVGKMVVRGMTLLQFQESVKSELSRVAYKDLKLYATLDKLRSIQISIAGEVFRPGNYAVSALTTLFNAINICGGPTENGTLRDIKLIKTNGTKSVDFYKFLMKGDSSQDYDLDNGDVILIPQIGRTITIAGEVKRPAIYELKESDNLGELIELAGGVRPTGFLQRIKIDSVDPSKRRIVLDIDLSDTSNLNTKLFDGDVVTVFSIPSEKLNTVTIEGKVNMPGVYQLRDGMKILDLINSAQDLTNEAYKERADLIRLNPDKRTTTLIPIDLSKVLVGDNENNILLNQLDKLIIYSKSDIKWVADRVVSIHGAIQKPGSYERSDGMTIYDLLIKAGGILPSAYLDRASLMRRNNKGELTIYMPINLDLALKKDKENNLLLEDGDILLIYTYKEAKWEADRTVQVTGAIQRTGVYTRTDGMKVSDLINIAGGLLPDAYPNMALLLRLGERQMTTQGFFINLKLALEDDPSHNFELKDGDELIIYKYNEARWEPKREVSINGAIQKIGTFERTDGMRVSNLIQRAGGILPNAYMKRADLMRFGPDFEQYMTIPINLGEALLHNEKSDILLEDGDTLRVYTIKEAEYEPENSVTIYGAVQRPDTYIKSLNMKLSDLLFLSGGILQGASSAEVSRIEADGKSISLPVNIKELAEGDTSIDIDLRSGDVIFVRKESNFLEKLQIVTINGEVKYPGKYALKQDETLIQLIQRAGGLTDNAYPEASTITRDIDQLVFNEQKNSIRQLGVLFNELANQEYQREYASALLKSGVTSQQKTKGASNSQAGSVVTDIIQGVVGTGIGALTQVPEQLQSTTSELEEIRQEQITIVSPARKINSLLPSGRLLVDVTNAIIDPKSKDNLILRDRDVIVIPSKSFTISIAGAVMQPSSLVYNEKYKLNDYVKMSGGYSRDADIKAVYVVKANGKVVKSENEKLAPGDIIVVPTKVMVQKVTDRWGQVLGVIKFGLGAFAMLYAVKLILG
jgi:protein involved in polysaccharide export with SLBB domain